MEISDAGHSGMNGRCHRWQKQTPVPFKWIQVEGDLHSRHGCTLTPGVIQLKMEKTGKTPLICLKLLSRKRNPAPHQKQNKTKNRKKNAWPKVIFSFCYFFLYLLYLHFPKALHQSWGCVITSYTIEGKGASFSVHLKSLNLNCTIL